MSGRESCKLTQFMVRMYTKLLFSCSDSDSFPQSIKTSILLHSLRLSLRLRLRWRGGTCGTSSTNIRSSSHTQSRLINLALCRTQNTPYMLYLSSGKVPPPSFKQTPRGVNGTILSASRDTYEKLLRYLVRKIPNVRWMSGTVTGLRCKEGCASTVEGIMVRIPDTKEPGNGDTFIPASLVIG